jgi:hypothetical protein
VTDEQLALFHERAERLKRLRDLDAPVLFLVCEVRLILKGLLQAGEYAWHNSVEAYWLSQMQFYPGFEEAWKAEDKKEMLETAGICVEPVEGKLCGHRAADGDHLCPSHREALDRFQAEQDKWEAEHPEEVLDIEAQVLLDFTPTKELPRA